MRQSVPFAKPPKTLHPYEKKPVMTVPLAGKGWHFPWGAMGMCPLGDGYWYLAEGGKTKDPETGKRLNSGKAVLYYRVEADTPFKKVETSPEHGSFQ